MLTLQDLSDIPEVFSVILCFLQITDIAVLASRAFHFAGNISRCLRSLVLVDECCSQTEKLRAWRLLNSRHDFLPCVTEDTRLQFVNISVTFEEVFKYPVKTLCDLMRCGHFRNVKYFADNVNVFSSFAKPLENVKGMNTGTEITSNDCLDITEYLHIQTVDATMISTQHFPQIDTTLDRASALADQMWPTLDVLRINVVYDGKYDFTNTVSATILGCCEIRRFPSVKIIHFNAIETEPLYDVVDWLVSMARGEKVKPSGDVVYYADSLWTQVEELKLDMVYSFPYFGDFYSEFIRVKQNWLEWFRRVTNSSSSIIGTATFPILFPSLQRVILCGKIPCWKIMTLFEQIYMSNSDVKLGTTSIPSSVSMSIEQELASMRVGAAADKNSPCFADIFTPCPCTACMGLPYRQAQRFGGLALTCSSDDPELSMYLSDFLQHDRLRISYLEITARSATEDDDLSSLDSEDDSDEICTTNRKISIYGGLLNAIEGQALQSLRYLHVNESFLYLCDCYSNKTVTDKKKCNKKMSREEETFLVLRNCPYLEVLIIDLDLIPIFSNQDSNNDACTTAERGYVTVFSTFLRKCLLPAVGHTTDDVNVNENEYYLKELTSIKLTVTTLQDFDLIFAAFSKAALDLPLTQFTSSTNASKGEGSHPRNTTNLGSGGGNISLLVSIVGLKCCRVGYILR